MTDLQNKEILEKGNAAIVKGDNEVLLSYCADDTHWIFMGDQTLKGKEAVRQYMKAAYVEPPKFSVSDMISKDNFVIAIGEITLKNEAGKPLIYSYCDVWKFKDGKIVELRAFVVEK